MAECLYKRITPGYDYGLVRYQEVSINGEPKALLVNPDTAERSLVSQEFFEQEFREVTVEEALKEKVQEWPAWR